MKGSQTAPNNNKNLPFKPFISYEKTPSFLSLLLRTDETNTCVFKGRVIKNNTATHCGSPPNVGHNVTQREGLKHEADLSFISEYTPKMVDKRINYHNLKKK